ncbi:hypothetical protein RirG_045130 [Rhizophagus irregularis DAOM 197198w]|uniref:Uncharacterized protein n=1 Tax=Rhizophagus irregularis (strain DAOM 197198w) TaxID=1432141 RepID=A0A015L5Z3_RHIIW|nr:hypothetical protein RirG_045130 [Rhizophagus irregularis DAOM 197198w]
MTESEEEWPKRRRGEECGDDLESRVGLLQQGWSWERRASGGPTQYLGRRANAGANASTCQGGQPTR